MKGDWWMQAPAQPGTGTEQAAITNASVAHSVTDPADAPGTADILRDDLVANAIPDVEAALNALGVKVNSILAALRDHDIIAE